MRQTVLRGCVVAVVDDDASVREALDALLSSLGCVSRTFASAQEFLDSEMLDVTQCLVLDIAMPAMSGPALHRELSRRRLPISVVFLTAQEDSGLRQRLIDAGAVDVLRKPAIESKLVAALSSACRRD